MGLEKDLLASTEIFVDKFNSKRETNIGSSSLPINTSISFENRMSQLQIIQKYQEQISNMTA